MATSPLDKLDHFGKTTVAALKQMEASAFDAIVSSEYLAQANTLLRQLPRSPVYADVRSELKKQTVALTDLHEACVGFILIGEDARTAIKDARSSLITSLKPMLKDLSERPMAGLDAAQMEQAWSDRKSGEVAAGDDKQAEIVQKYYEKTMNLPSTYKQNSGVLLVRNPVVVLGVFGPALERIRSLGVPVREFIEGYSVFDNQLLLGFDLSEVEKHHGIKRGGDKKSLAKLRAFAQDILVQYNARHSRKFSLVNDEPRMFNGLAYYWVLPERQLTMLRTRFPQLKESWGFPTKVSRVSDKVDTRKITDDKIDHIFNMAFKGREVDFMAEKLNLEPAIIAAILNGSELPHKTVVQRRELRELQQRYHKQFVEQKKSIDKELLDQAYRDKRLGKQLTPEQQQMLNGQWRSAVPKLYRDVSRDDAP